MDTTKNLRQACCGNLVYFIVLYRETENEIYRIKEGKQPKTNISKRRTKKQTCIIGGFMNINKRTPFFLSSKCTKQSSQVLLDVL